MNRTDIRGQLQAIAFMIVTSAWCNDPALDLGPKIRT